MKNKDAGAGARPETDNHSTATTTHTDNLQQISNDRNDEKQHRQARTTRKTTKTSNNNILLSKYYNFITKINIIIMVSYTLIL